MGALSDSSTSGASRSVRSHGVMELKGAGLPAGLLVLVYALSLQVISARVFGMF